MQTELIKAHQSLLAPFMQRRCGHPASDAAGYPLSCGCCRAFPCRLLVDEDGQCR
jgi:hypothetical protein